MSTVHVPVMMNEVLAYLKPERGGLFLDCTLGGGGHTRAILASSPNTSVVALDRDERALGRAEVGLAEFKPRLKLLHSNFADISNVLGDARFVGILADLGLSTDQLKEARGFSFADEAPLDMRMDESQPRSAFHVVNETDERTLMQVLARGGVGKHARLVAKAIIRERPLETARDLARVVNKTLAGKSESRTKNPATVTFQAIRIEVNDELRSIETLLDVVPTIIMPGGRVVIISFHSLEDKVVGHRFRSWQGSTGPANWPGSSVVPALGKLLTKKAVEPADDEIMKNSNARSARLRAFEFHVG